MSTASGATAVRASVAFLKIQEFARRPVMDQMRLRAQLEAVIAVITADLTVAGRIVLDASDGAAIVVLGDAPGALRRGGARTRRGRGRAAAVDRPQPRRGAVRRRRQGRRRHERRRHLGRRQYRGLCRAFAPARVARVSRCPRRRQTRRRDLSLAGRRAHRSGAALPRVVRSGSARAAAAPAALRRARRARLCRVSRSRCRLPDLARRSGEIPRRPAGEGRGLRERGSRADQVLGSAAQPDPAAPKGKAARDKAKG